MFRLWVVSRRASDAEFLLTPSQMANHRPIGLPLRLQQPDPSLQLRDFGIFYFNRQPYSVSSFGYAGHSEFVLVKGGAKSGVDFGREADVVGEE